MGRIRSSLAFFFFLRGKFLRSYLIPRRKWVLKLNENSRSIIADKKVAVT